MWLTTLDFQHIHTHTTLYTVHYTTLYFQWTIRCHNTQCCCTPCWIQNVHCINYVICIQTVVISWFIFLSSAFPGNWQSWLCVIWKENQNKAWWLFYTCIRTVYGHCCNLKCWIYLPNTGFRCPCSKRTDICTKIS